jgi:hypothetical protein
VACVGLLCAAWLAAGQAHAQNLPADLRPTSSSDPAPGVDPLDPMPMREDRGEGAGITPFVAPVPFKNTQIGWGLFLLLGVIHRLDADTTLKPSTGAAGGFYSENDSWGVMAMEMARLSGDAWRVRGGYSHMDVRYDFYGVGEDAGAAGRSVGLRQPLDFGVLAGLHRVTHHVYLGAAVMGMQTRVELRDSLSSGFSGISGDLPSIGLFAPGVQGELDSRDDDYWPTRGSLATLKSWFFTKALGGSRSFQRYFAAWSWYGPLRGRQLVLASNFTTSAATGDAPFYFLPSVGAGRNGLRGYTQGRYRDRVMVTAQTEARYHTSGRLGVTVFGGIGGVASSVAHLADVRALPAGGLGLRLQLTRNFPMHMRLDYAWGRDGGLLYFSVAEAF